MDSIDDVPFWAWLAAIGAAGGLFRYLRPRGKDVPPLTRQDFITHIGLGGMVGPTVTLSVHSMASGQGIVVGHPAQCLLALCVGGAAVYLFDLGSKFVERSGDRAGRAADKKLDNLDAGKTGEGEKS